MMILTNNDNEYDSKKTLRIPKYELQPGLFRPEA